LTARPRCTGAAYLDDLELATKTAWTPAGKPGAVNRYGDDGFWRRQCINGDARMVELLLEHGADANQSLPGGGETPLMNGQFADGKKPAAVARPAREKARWWTRKEVRGQTALVWAATEGQCRGRAGADQGWSEFSKFA